MKKRIIVCGYPKSGTTWLTRLTAEIVGCPSAGMWCDPLNEDVVIEGLEKESEYDCFKAHHNLNLLKRTLRWYGNGTEKIIYVLRDPRDIVVSGSHYYGVQIPRHQLVYKAVKQIPAVLRIYDGLFHSQKYKLDLLTQQLIEGTPIRTWRALPWKAHVKGYLENDVLKIKYEDLKINPLAEVKKICSYLNIERSEDELIESIKNQSFGKKKKMFVDQNQLMQVDFLRSGSIGQWKKVLSTENHYCPVISRRVSIG